MELHGWGILVGSDGLMERKWYEVNTFFKFSVGWHTRREIEEK